MKLITKSIAGLLLAGVYFTAFGETEERMQKRYSVQPGGKLVVDVDFGSIQLGTNGSSEVTVEIVRLVSRGNKPKEEEFLNERPISISKDGNTVTISVKKNDTTLNWSWRGSQRLEAKYTITVPSQFVAQLKTSGGTIAVTDLTGELKAKTSGGGLRFTRINGVIEGTTSGGSIKMMDSEGTLKIHTSGGGIEVAGGKGTLTGETSGGSVSVRDFRGPVTVESSGGSINLENLSGKVIASTSGGSISAVFPAKLTDEVKLETSGGGVRINLAEISAFDLDASTSGGSVSSDLPVQAPGKPSRSHLKGPVNGGGIPVYLRTSGGSIRVKKI
jgi:hypothetical protein